MSDDSGALMRRERMRERLEIAGMVMRAVGMAIAGFTLAVADSYPGLAVWEDRLGLFGLGLAGLGAIVGLATWRSRAERRALDARLTRRDKAQGFRARQLATMPFAMVGVLVIAMMALSRILRGEGDMGDMMFAGLVALLAWVVPAIVMGWDGGSRKERKWLEDELTREWRGRAMSAGFVVLMAGVSGIYLIGLWRPEWAILGLPIVLFASGAVAGLRFAWLDRQGEAGDD